MNKLSLRVVWALFMVAGSLSAWAQTCQVRDEIPDQTRSAIENSAQRIFEQASSGDTNTIKANTITNLQSNFNGIASAINDNKAAFAGAKPQVRNSFLLDTGANPSPDGRFYCGIFEANGMSANSAAFDIPGLPVGKYSIVILDFTGNRGPYSLTTIFQDQGGWKLAGFYVRPESALGHDGIWFLQHARDYKSKGQNHNAWFYYSTSWDLLAPVTFMDTRLLSKIIQESNGVQPKDVPVGGKPVAFSANGKSYSITDMSVYRLANTFDLNIRYSVPSTADFSATQADARQLANAYVAQYPELKDTFNNIYAHAVDSSGGDVVGLVTLKAAK